MSDNRERAAVAIRVAVGGLEPRVNAPASRLRWSKRDRALNRPHPLGEHAAGRRRAGPKIGSELSWFADKFSFALATRKFGAIGRVGAS